MVASLAAWESSGSYLSLGGRRIFHWERGEGRPLIGLHGFPASSFDWRSVADTLAARRFVALDFPGFGLSDKSSTGDYSISAYADTVEGLAKELGIGECILLQQ